MSLTPTMIRLMTLTQTLKTLVDCLSTVMMTLLRQMIATPTVTSLLSNRQRVLVVKLDCQHSCVITTCNAPTRRFGWALLHTTPITAQDLVKSLSSL